MSDPELERGAFKLVNGNWSPSDHEVQVSIALSLKRIADALAPPSEEQTHQGGSSV